MDNIKNDLHIPKMVDICNLGTKVMVKHWRPMLLLALMSNVALLAFVPIQAFTSVHAPSEDHVTVDSKPLPRVQETSQLKNGVKGLIVQMGAVSGNGEAAAVGAHLLGWATGEKAQRPGGEDAGAADSLAWLAGAAVGMMLVLAVLLGIFFLISILSVIGYGGVVHIVAAHFVGEEPTFKEAARSGRQRLGRLFATWVAGIALLQLLLLPSVLTIIGVVIGLVSAVNVAPGAGNTEVDPGPLLALFFLLAYVYTLVVMIALKIVIAFSLNVAAMEPEVWGFAALFRSSQLTKGFRWKLLVFSMALGVASVLANGIARVFCSILGPLAPLGLVVAVIAISLANETFNRTCISIAYISCRAKLEPLAFEHEDLAAFVGRGGPKTQMDKGSKDIDPLLQTL